jgi:hypothetical protein
MAAVGSSLKSGPRAKINPCEGHQGNPIPSPGWPSFCQTRNTNPAGSRREREQGQELLQVRLSIKLLHSRLLPGTKKSDPVIQHVAPASLPRAVGVGKGSVLRCRCRYGVLYLPTVRGMRAGCVPVNFTTAAPGMHLSLVFNKPFCLRDVPLTYGSSARFMHGCPKTSKGDSWHGVRGTLRGVAIGYFSFAAPDLQLASSTHPRFTNPMEAFCIQEIRTSVNVHIVQSLLLNSLTSEVRKPGPARSLWLFGRRGRNPVNVEHNWDLGKLSDPRHAIYALHIGTDTPLTREPVVRAWLITGCRLSTPMRLDFVAFEAGASSVLMRPFSRSCRV